MTEQVQESKAQLGADAVENGKQTIDRDDHEGAVLEMWPLTGQIDVGFGRRDGGVDRPDGRDAGRGETARGAVERAADAHAEFTQSMRRPLTTARFLSHGLLTTASKYEGKEE